MRPFLMLSPLVLVVVIIALAAPALAATDSVEDAVAAPLSPDAILKGISIVVQILFGIGGVVGWVAGIWIKKKHDSWRSELDRETETHRMRLKKSELLFEERVRAARDLNGVIGVIDKSVGPHIMEQCEYHEAIARDFRQYRDLLEAYLAKHAIILPPPAASRLQNAEGRAYEYCSGFPEYEEATSRIRAAAYIDQEVRSALRLLQEDIFNQAGP